MANRKDLINMVAERTGLSKKAADEAIRAFCDSVTSSLVAGDSVQLVGFGTFSVKDRPAREGHNPQTGEKIRIAAKRVPSFKPGKALKDVVNK